MAQTDLVIELPTKQSQRLRADRHSGHRAVMSMLPDGIGVSPRAATQTLWRVDPDRNELLVRSSAELTPAPVGKVVRVGERARPGDGSQLRLTVDLACLKTPKSDVPDQLRASLKQSGGAYRSHTVIVPEPERPDWARARLERLGLKVESIQVSQLMSASLGSRGGRIPFVTVTATATVVESNAFDAALTCGVGKGRSFGLGLIHTTAQKGNNDV